MLLSGVREQEGMSGAEIEKGKEGAKGGKEV